MHPMRYVNQKKYPDMPYITRTGKEGEEREQGKHTTVASSACGLCSAIMVADRLLPAYDFELEDAVALSYELGANHALGTDAKLFFPVFARKLGLRYEAAYDQEDLRRCLRTGGAGIVHVRANQGDYVAMFTKSGHYMAVINEEPDGRFAILDPSYVEGKYQQGQDGDKVEVVHGVITLCPPDILAKEAVVGKPPYHLFWRG